MHLNIFLILLVVSNRANMMPFRLYFIVIEFYKIQVQDRWYKEDLYVKYKWNQLLKLN